MVRNKTDDDDDACDVDVLTCCTLKPLNSLYPIRKLHYPQGRVGPGKIWDRKTKQSPDQRTGGTGLSGIFQHFSTSTDDR